MYFWSTIKCTKHIYTSSLKNSEKTIFSPYVCGKRERERERNIYYYCLGMSGKLTTTIKKYQ